MVSGYLLLIGAAVDDVLSTCGEWWGPAAAVTGALAVVAAAGADSVRTRIRALSGRVRVRRASSPLTSPDTVRMRPADDRPDASGHIPGGGP